jgi:hypothetical protein
VTYEEATMKTYRRTCLAVALAAAAACHSSSPTPVVSPGAPDGLAALDLKLNAQKSGVFACSGGLFFAAIVTNGTAAALRVDTLGLTFTKVSGSACESNAAPIDPQVGMTVAPGVSSELRRVDLAGQLCDGPSTAPGCEWLARATASTSRGVLTDEIPFRTAATADSPVAVPGTNSPPVVRISGGGACHPLPSRACTVEFRASSEDPDGDRVSLAWSGCASGNAARATCVVDRPGEQVATVEARDGRGGVARASASAEGTNLPPVVHLGGPRPPNPAPSNALYLLTGGQPVDPEDDAHPNALCGTATITASGPCRVTLDGCGGVGDVFDAIVRTQAGPGTCTVEARVRDPWGAVGIDRITFSVSPP